MGCGPCGSGGGGSVTLFQVNLPNGETKNYLTQSKAERVAAETGGTWAEVRRQPS